MFHNRSKVFFILSLVFVLLVGAVLFTGAYEEEDTYNSLSSKPAVQYLFGTAKKSNPSINSTAIETSSPFMADSFSDGFYIFVEFDYLQTGIEHRAAPNVYLKKYGGSDMTAIATIGARSPYPAEGTEPEIPVSLGWHHVCIMLSQRYSVTEDVVSYYLLSKVFVDGVPTDEDFTEISINDEDDGHRSNNRLYSVDAEAGFVTIEGAPYNQEVSFGAELGTENKGVLIKNVLIGTGTAPSKEIVRVFYELNGGSFAEDFEVIPQTTNGKTTYPEAAFYTPDVIHFYITETLSGDIVASPAPHEYTLPADPVRSGYRFTGWYADDELRDEVTAETLDDFLSSGTDVTLYAGWEESPYTLTLSVDGVETPADGSTLPVGTV